MTKVWATIKAIFTRLIFAFHGFLAIWQVAQSKRDPLWWALCTPIVLLVFEGTFTIFFKKSQEWRWFCPSVFLYLSSVVPAIWLLELDKMDRRTNKLYMGDDIALRPPNFKDLDKILGNQFKIPEIKVDTSTWITLIEQFLMLILIIGRWMLPKGDLTKDQLSQLLLVYIGTAADIIEFFDSFKDNTIANEKLLVFLTLGIWSWSLLQFTIVLSATRARKPRGGGGNNLNHQDDPTNCCCSIDACGIFLNILLQDAPFLAFRLLIIIHYKIISYMNVFFTSKNTLVILLQLYRLSVVHSEGRKAKRMKMIQAMEEGRNLFIISGMETQSNKKKGSKKKRDIEEEQPVISHKSSKQQQIKKKQLGKKDTGYSTASSSCSESSVDEKKYKNQKKRRTNQDSGKRKKKSDRSRSKRKKIIEERVSEEGSNSTTSEVVVVEVKEKKPKKKQRKCSTSASSSD